MKFLLIRFKNLALGFFLVICFLSCQTQPIYSASVMHLSDSEGIVVEHLRLHVPKGYLKEWLLAEKDSWEKWLEKKNGFLGRQLLWDPNNEEATILINWSGREKWKAISQDEIELVQENFEKIARDSIGQVEGNPFPLIFEGELLPQ
tara:strand:- start:665 stop:1105 length:441 start_codon:yes stop_codon:yes gene_type:complete